MFIAAKRRGSLVALIAFGCLVLSELLTTLQFHDASYYAHHGWPKAAGFVAAAAIVWMLESRRGEEVLGVNAREAHPQPFFRGHDSLFAIPVKYWPAILCLMGLAAYFIRA